MHSAQPSTTGFFSPLSRRPAAPTFSESSPCSLFVRPCVPLLTRVPHALFVLPFLFFFGNHLQRTSFRWYIPFHEGVFSPFHLNNRRPNFSGGGRFSLFDFFVTAGGRTEALRGKGERQELHPPQGRSPDPLFSRRFCTKCNHPTDLWFRLAGLCSLSRASMALAKAGNFPFLAGEQRHHISPGVAGI